MDPETQNEPLLAAQRQQAAANAQGGRSPSRAYKVAGITLLACILIVGQATIAYFLLSQRDDIKSLKEQNNNLQSELTNGRSVSVPMRMQMPMKALSALMDVAVDEDKSTRAPEKTLPLHATDCQLEEAGMKPEKVPGFRPVCDEHGQYRAKQCYMDECWCVNQANGQMIPGSMGQANCNARAVGNKGWLTLHNVDA